MFTFFHFPDSGLYLLTGFDFYFDLFWIAWHWKPAIIYGHPEAFVGKLRKLLDCEDVRHNMRAVVIDEAYLVVEWQVFNFCL